MEYKYANYVITNKRGMARFGLINRSHVDILIDRVQGINISQGIIGGMLNFGTIYIDIAGRKQVFAYIKDPSYFMLKPHEVLRKS